MIHYDSYIVIAFKTHLPPVVVQPVRHVCYVNMLKQNSPTMCIGTRIKYCDALNDSTTEKYHLINQKSFLMMYMYMYNINE